MPSSSSTTRMCRASWRRPERRAPRSFAPPPRSRRPGRPPGRRRGQAHRERGAPTHFRLDRQFPTVALDDAVGHAQSQTIAALPLGGEERLEQAVADRLGDAHPRVLNRQDNMGRRGPCAHREGAPHGHGVDGVEDQVGHDLAQFGGIAAHRGGPSSWKSTTSGVAEGWNCFSHLNRVTSAVWRTRSARSSDWNTTSLSRRAQTSAPSGPCGQRPRRRFGPT